MAAQYKKKELPKSTGALAWSLLWLGLLLMGIGYVKDLTKVSHDSHGTDSHAEAGAEGHGDSHSESHGDDHKVADGHADAHADDHGGHHAPDRSWYFFYLVMFMFLLSIALGSLFWVGLEYLMNANWSTPLRRIPEFFSGTIVLVGLLSIPLVFDGMKDIFFHWIPLPMNDPVLVGKSAWLNPTRFSWTVLILFVVWYVLHSRFFSRSVQQDESGDPALTHKSLKLAPKFIVIWALTLTVAAIDWMMTLNPHWFSTMWGVYYFSGTLTASIALCLFVSILLFEKGYLHPRMKKDSFYSMSTLMFGFNCFWAYIAFCQYMLIWYANMPEETVFFTPRWQGNWIGITVFLIVFHFVIPVFLLVPRRAKTNLPLLKFMSVWLIIAHYIDMYWVIMPTYTGHISCWDFILSLGFPLFAVGLIMVFFVRQSKKYNMVPVKDPRLELGLGFALHTVDSDE